MKIKNIKLTNNKMLINALKGCFVAISFSLVAILIFAIIIKIANIPNKYIMPINQIIKIVSIFMGCLSANKYHKTNGLIKGLIIGVCYTILSFLIFSALSKSFVLSMSIFYDILFSAIIGIICGVFIVNMKNRA